MYRYVKIKLLRDAHTIVHASVTVCQCVHDMCLCVCVHVCVCVCMCYTSSVLTLLNKNKIQFQVKGHKNKFSPLNGSMYYHFEGF